MKSLVKAMVTQLIGKPYFNKMWCINVEAHAFGDFGSDQKTIIRCSSNLQAASIKLGHVFYDLLTVRSIS